MGTTIGRDKIIFLPSVLIELIISFCISRALLLPQLANVCISLTEAHW
jgi:hypothetical protein